MKEKENLTYYICKACKRAILRSGVHPNDIWSKLLEREMFELKKNNTDITIKEVLPTTVCPRAAYVGYELMRIYDKLNPFK